MTVHERLAQLEGYAADADRRALAAQAAGRADAARVADAWAAMCRAIALRLRKASGIEEE